MEEAYPQFANLQLTLLKSERFRIVCVLGFVAFFEAVYAVRVFVLGSLLPHWGLFAIPIFGLYELLALIAVQHSLVTGKDLPQAVWGFNVLLELCMPALALATLIGPRLPDIWAPLASPFILTYFPLLMLSILRFNPSLSCMGGGVAACGYFMAAYYRGWRIDWHGAAHSTVEQSAVIIYGILILASGLVAGAVAREMQKYVRAAVLEAETLFQVRLEERIRERTRIARELHDTLLQSFQGLLLRFQTVSTQLQEGAVKQTLDSAIDQAADAVTEARDAVQAMRKSPLDKGNFGGAIRALGEELAGNVGLQTATAFQVVVEGEPRKLHPVVQNEAYRVAAEALRNAFQHAHANLVKVEIRYNQLQFKIRIHDNGIGIDPNVLSGPGRPGHYGLHGMRERAKLVRGDLDIWSELAAGTEVLLAVPANSAYMDSARRSWWSWIVS
jgi:signal transduction histidine kinase